MVREHLGVILGPAEPLDPLSGEPMLLGSSRTRDLAVGHVSHEQVPEGVFALSRDRGPALATHELLPLEPVQGLLGSRPFYACDLRSGPQPEHLAENRSVLKERLLLVGQRIEPGRHDSLHRLGERQLALSRQELAIGDHPDELLGVERVSARPLQERGLGLGRKDRPLEQGRQEARGLVVVERRERECERVRLPSAPARAAREQLRPSSADHENRNPAGPIHEVVDEVEQALVGPVQVFEDEDERPLLGECLEEAPPRCKSLGPMVALELLLALEPDQRSQVPLDPVGLRLVDELAHAPCQLARRLFGRVRLEHACLRLHHLAERPEGDAFAVRQRPALTPARQLGFVLDHLRELVDEAALADSRDADEGDQLRRTLCPDPA